MDNYHKKLFLDNYRTEEEAEKQRIDTDEFATWLCANPEKAAPLFKWHCNFYFNGLDEESLTCLFDEDIVRCAKAGITKPLLIDTTAKGCIVNYSLYGVMAGYFKQPYDFDKIERDYVYELLEDIRKSSDIYVWKKLDWDYFIEKHWFMVISEVFEKEAEDFNHLQESFIIKQINEQLKDTGLICEFILKDDNYDPPHSGMGIDFSKCFPGKKVFQLKAEDLK